MTPQLRAAGPADGKAVWDSIIAAGGKPTFGGVAKALNASGQFAPVNKMQVKRWHDRGWAEAKTGVRKPAVEQAAVELDAAVPALSGKATTRMKDLVGQPDASDAAGESEPNGLLISADPEAVKKRDALKLLGDDTLAKRANRALYIAAIILLEHIQERPGLLELRTREIGTLQGALAGSLTAANGGFKVLLEMQDKLLDLVPGPPPENGAAEPPPDPLADALDAFRRAEDEH